MSQPLNLLVSQAVSGNKDSLEKVIYRIQDLVYNLSLRMLLFPEDAQDATQDILVKIVTHLSTFNGDSNFRTWVYRVSINFLLTAKSKQSKRLKMSLEEYEQFIDSGQSSSVHHAQNEGELLLLEEEVKVSCTRGLLMCLNPNERATYILGEILEFNGNEGAEILSISPPNFRKQLSRSRMKIRNFLQKKCGLINSANACRCHKKIDFLANQEMISKDNLKFANQTNRSIDLINQISELEKTTAIYRLTPNLKTPDLLKKKVQEILQSF